MSNRKIIVDYTYTTNFAHPISEEAQALFDIIKKYSTVNDIKWKMSNDLLSLEAGYKGSQAKYIDLNDLALIIFQAGIIQGIREERKRKNKLSTIF